MHAPTAKRQRASAGAGTGAGCAQPAGEALRAFALQILSRAQAVVDDTARPTRAVHDIRRCLKRWRALLRMLAPHLGEEAEALRVGARDLARRLAAARDAQAALDALEDAATSARERPAGLSQRSLAAIRTRLSALREAGERRDLGDDLRQAVGAHVTEATRQVAHWDLRALTESDVARLLARTYRKARNAIPENWDGAAAANLHALRRRVVEHRYQMVLMQPAWPRLGRLWVDEAQRLRTRLGRHQDLAVLAGMTAPHAPLARWRGTLMPLIRARQAEHRQAARRIARRLFAEKPKAFRRRIERLWRARGEGDEHRA